MKLHIVVWQIEILQFSSSCQKIVLPEMSIAEVHYNFTPYELLLTGLLYQMHFIMDIILSPFFLFPFAKRLLLPYTLQIAQNRNLKNSGVFCLCKKLLESYCADMSALC